MAGSIVAFAFLFVLYFLPSVHAAWRHHPNQNSIFIINFFLGWTLLGWVAAAAMSASHISDIERAEVARREAVSAQCSECGADASPSARYCPACGVQFEVPPRVVQG